MGTNMSNVLIQFRKNDLEPQEMKTNYPSQDANIKIYYLDSGDYAKPFEFTFKVSHDKKKMYLEYYDPIEDQIHSRWINRK